MKKITLLFIALLSSLLIFSCSDEPDGSIPVNDGPKIMLYDTSDIISSKETRVQWYGNDEDGTEITYYYCITTDLDLQDSVAIETMDGYWESTTESYVDLSMPFAPYPETTTPITIDDSLYIDPVAAIEVQREIVYSKFFLYAVDEKGETTNVVSKIFGRTNTIPKYPMLNSVKLDINGFEQHKFVIGPDSAVMVLSNETNFWKPIDFRWIGDDPDGPDVDLEFRWELWALDTLGNDVEIIQESDWSMSNLSVEFSSVIHSYDSEGEYSFRLWVRDDAFEIGLPYDEDGEYIPDPNNPGEFIDHAQVDFFVFAPQLDHGILYLDDTDDSKYDMNTWSKRGNPDGAAVNARYEQFLQNAGYTADNADPLKRYDVYNFTVPPAGMLYQPTLKVLSKYRLVIIASEDRTKSSGIDYAAYKSQLSDYMNIGGKVMVVGNSAILMSDLVVNDYQEPVRDVFNNPFALMNTDMLTFFYNYFGIYSYSTGESKTFFAQGLYDLGHNLHPDDYYLKDNYDFIGAIKYEHIEDQGIVNLKVDSARVNEYWKDYNGPGGVWEFALKDNGSVLTGIPVFEAYKGEIVLKYQSIFDLEQTDYNDSLVYEYNGTDSLIHDLYWRNPVADDTENPGCGKVLQKNGAVVTRYVSEGDVFRTAYVGFPMIFMDDSNGEVSDFFTAMVEWFNLSDDPLDK